ncbi:MAG: DUF4363 family protein [Peptococcaceae bacterium]|nr:DUF4363 family protein [Peptococcaceae bacterium]
MRLLVALLVVFLAVVALGFWTNRLLQASTADLLEHIDKISADVKKENWEDALAKTSGLEKAWNKKAGWWPALLDHQEMDNIEFALSRVREYIAARNAALSRGELAELRLMIKHIPEKEAVSVKNIF